MEENTNDRLTESAPPITGNYNKVFRSIGFAVMLALFIESIVLMDWRLYLLGYTSWGLVMTFILSLILFSQMFYKENEALNNFSKIFFEVVWCSDVVITSFFWVVLFPLQLIMDSGSSDLPSPFANVAIIMNVVLFHTIPMAYIAIEFYFNDIIFIYDKWHVGYSYIPYVPYIIINLILSNVFGLTVYPILTWNNWESIVISIGLVLLNFGGFYFGFWLSKRKKLN